MSNFNEKGNLEITSIASGVQTDNVIVRNVTEDGDLLFYVNNGGTDTLALTIDASEDVINIPDGIKLSLGSGADGEIYSSSDDIYIRNVTADKDIIFSILDGAAQTTLMTLDADVSKVVIAGEVDLNARFDCQASISGGASPGHIIKCTMPTTETYTGSNAGLSIKMYDADNAVVHTEDELCGLYINLKQLSTIGGGGKSALISAHNYGSGGDYQVLDFGLRLFGDITDAIEVTGGTVTSAIKLDTCTALTNVLKLADGVGCTVGTTMVKDPENDQEAGFIAISVGGTSYQIPFYAIA